MSHFEKRIKVHQIVKNQVPEFVLADFPKAIEFLKQYYISQEYQGGNIDLIDNFDQYLNVKSLVPDALNSSAVLSADVSEDDTTITVSNTRAFPDEYGLLKIDDEIITYTGKTSTSFTGCIRGFSGVTEYKDRSVISNRNNNLIFKSTESAVHSSGKTVENLSSLFLNEFYKKIKYLIAPGLENLDLSNDIDVSLFLSNARSFFQSKGIEESINILFKVLYGTSAKVVDTEKFLIKPSSTNYVRRQVLVCEKLDGDNPSLLVGESLFSQKNPDVAGSISSVDIITRNAKVYYRIGLFIGYSDDILLENNFTLPGKSRVIGDVYVGSTVITVDTTIGYPDSGQLSCGNNTITYKSKSINQFFGCSGVSENITDGDLIIEDDIVFGYVDGDINRKVDLRLSAIVSSYKQIDEIISSEKGDQIFIKNSGYKIQNPETDKTYAEIFGNSWIYNTSTRYRVSEIDNNTIFKLSSKIDKSSLKVNDTVNIYQRNDNVPYASNGTILAVDVENNTVEINIPGFVSETGILYDIKRVLEKSSSTGVSIDNGNNVYTANVTNLYVDDELEFSYVASNSLPEYNIQKNIISYQIPNGTTTYLGGYDQNTDRYTTIVFPTTIPEFIDGDKITYKAESPLLGLENGREYFIRIVSPNSIRLYASYIITGAEDSYLRFNVAESLGIHKFIISRHSGETLSYNPILRKFPLTQDLSGKNQSKNDIGESGLLINGLEISSPVSRDKIYYGPLSSIDILNPGQDYDVVNPPEVILSAGAGTTALFQPVISGSVKEVLVDPQEFGIDKVFSLTLSGGNGSGCILEPIFTEKVTQLNFDARSITNGGGLDSVDNTITFLDVHNLSSGDEIVYDQLSNSSPVITDGPNNLVDSSSYFVRVVNTSTVKLFNTKNDSILGINTIGISTTPSAGIHALKTLPLKNIGRIRVVNSGSEYQNRKLIVKPTGISTVENTINWNNHGFNTGDIVEYLNDQTPISGLSTSNQYSIKKVNNDSFKLYDVGIGATIKENVERDIITNLTDFGSGYHIFKYPDIVVSASVGYAGTVQGSLTFTPIITGGIVDGYMYESGVGYGSSTLNFHRKPKISILKGSNCQLRPIIENGSIRTVQVLSTGFGYGKNPEISVVDSKNIGTGAILRPIVSDGKVINVLVIQGGIGYNENTTTINIADRGINALIDANVRSIKLNDIPRFGQYKLSDRRNRDVLTLSAYHYGQDLSSNFLDDGTNHSPIIGWAYDGNPIYGPYGFEDPNTFGSDIKQLSPSYVIDQSNIENRPVDSDFAFGTFIEDYKYVKGSGDLDEHNGRYCRTPEFPSGIYAYFATVQINPQTGQLSGKYPYFIGKTFRNEVLSENNFLDHSFDFNSSNLVRNVFPHKLGDPNAENDYIDESYETYRQVSEVVSTSIGKIDNIKIINPGDGYKVNENLVLDQREGTGFSAFISKVFGKNILNVNTTIEEYSNLSFEWNSDKSITIANIPYTNLDIDDGDYITVSGLSTNVSKLNNLPFQCSVEKQSGPISIAKTIPENLDPNGSFENAYVTTIPSFVSAGSSCIINGESFRILNVYEDFNLLKLRRFTVGSAHSETSAITFIPDRIKVNTKVSEDFISKHNTFTYFNAKRSVGVGTTAGLFEEKIYSVGIKTEAIGVPIRTIYIPNHGFTTGQELIFTKDSTVGVAALIVGNDETTLNTFGLPNLVTNSDTVYAINKGPNHIGLTTQVGLTTGNGLYFYTDGSDNYEYGLRTNYDQLTGSISKIVSEIETEFEHGLVEGDEITLSVVPEVNAGVGIGSTQVRLHIDGSRLLVNKTTFSSSDVNTSENTITISEHGYNDGDKVYYAGNSLISGVEEGEYYIRYFTRDKIKLCKSTYDLIFGNIDVDFGSTGGSSQSLSLINPPIEVAKNNKLVFNLGDESLSGYEFGFYYDHEFNSEFTSTNDAFEYNVEELGIGIGLTLSSYVLSYTDSLPILYYNVRKSGFINTSDVSVRNYNQIKYVKSNKFDGTYPVVNVSAGRTFQVSPVFTPPLLSLTKSNTSTLEYTTSSTNVSGPIADFKILSKGFGYKTLPFLDKIETENGKNASILVESDDIGRVNEVRIIDPGFDYSPDKTLRPESSTPYPITLLNADSGVRVDIIDGGSQYLSSPDLVLINNDTREVVDTESFEATAPSGKITNISLIQNLNGLADTTHTLFAVNNSNGVGISSIVGGPTGVVTCSLVTPFIGFSTSIFSVGEKVFVENIENQVGDTGEGYNSSNYGYQFFEVLDYINTNPAVLKYKLPETATNPGLAKTFQLGYAQIISSKNYPTFEFIQERPLFKVGEVLFVSEDGGNSFVKTDLKVTSSRKDFIKVSGSYELVKGYVIRGEITGYKGTIENTTTNRAKYEINFSNVEYYGWANDIGKLSEEYQVIPDNDYYQNMAYAIKTSIPFEDCIDPVNSIVHPVGLKNFVDVGITSSVLLGKDSTLQSEANIVLDVKSERRVDTINIFDIVTEVDILNTNPQKSKYIRTKNKKFTDYVICKTNRALQIDNISSLFTSKESSLGFTILDEMQEDYARYLVQIINPDTNEIQLTEVIATNSTNNIFTTKRATLNSDTNSGTSEGAELGDIYGIFDSPEDTKKIVFAPTDQYDSDFDIKVLTSLFNFQQLGIGTVQKQTIGSVDLIASNVGVGTTTLIPLENAIATFDRSNFGAVFATLFVENNETQEHSVVDYSAIYHDGEIYEAEFFLDNDSFNYSINQIGIVTTRLVGSNKIEIRVINDETSPLTVRSQIVSLTNTPGISTYYFDIPGQTPESVRTVRFESSEITSSGNSIGIVSTNIDSSSANSYIKVSTGSTFALHRLLLVHDTEKVYTTQFPFFSNDDISEAGIGTFGGEIVGSSVNLNFYPDLEYVGAGVTIQGFHEIYFNQLDLLNIPDELSYGSNTTKLFQTSYDGVNGSRADKKQFPLNYKGTPIYQKTFAPNATTISLDGDGVATFNIPNHFFNTGEELTYTPTSSFDNVFSAIGIGLTADYLGVTTTLLPEKVYPIVLTPDTFKLSTRPDYASAGIAITITNYGTGNAHKLEMTKKLSKAVISLDGIVQQPISYTTVSHKTLYNDSNIVSVGTTFFAMSGISSIQPRDILKIDDEYMKVVEVGLSSSSNGPIGLVAAGIAATIPCVAVERGVVGSGISSHIDGTEVKIYRGSFDIVESDIFFLDAPKGNARNERDNSNLPFPTSSFNGRVFTRSSYNENIVFDDISNSFTGIGQTYTITSNGINTTGLSNGNGIVFINGVFQTPTTANNIGNNYELDVDESIGISSIQFTGITSVDGSFIKSDFDINQNQLPRGGLIVSLGSTNGLGYAELRGSIVGLITDSSGSIIDILTSPSRNRDYAIQTASYDNVSGILNITTVDNNTFEENDLIQLEGLEFSCAAPHAGVTTTIFPDGSSPSGFTFSVESKYSNNNFDINVGVSTIPHTYVGFGTAYEYLDNLNNGSGYRGPVSVAVTDASYAGSGAEISATVGAGGTLTFTIDQPGTGYLNPILNIPNPIYENMQIVGKSRLGIGTTTDTGSNLLLNLSVGQNSNPIFNDRFADAANLIEANKELIAEVAVGRMLAAFPSFTIPNGNQNCIDDIVDVLESISYNLRYGGNDLVYDAANLYITGAHVAGEEAESVYAYEEAKSMAIEAMTNVQITIGGYSNKIQVFDLSITADPQTGSNADPNSCANVASAIETYVGIVTNAIDSSTLPSQRTVAPGSLYEINGFAIARPGHSFNVGDKFTVVGLVTDARLSEPISEFELEVVEIFNDFFAGWQFGELDYIDSFKNLQDGRRTRFPLFYNGELISFEKEEESELSSLIDLDSILIIFVNGVIQSPGIAYRYEGGTSINFDRAPDVDDEVDVFFYVGDRNVDIDQSDIRETIKKGDGVFIKKNPTILGTKSQERNRTVVDLSTSDTIETDIYTGFGIDDVNERALEWIKQKSDLVINNENVSKARPIYEPRIFPTAKVIGSIDSSSTNIFVDEARHFFIEEDIFNEVISNVSALVVDNTPIIAAAATAVVSPAGTIQSIDITQSGSGYIGDETISIAHPGFRNDVGIGTTMATATLNISNGIVIGATIGNVGAGYTPSAPPSVLIKSPDFKFEQFNGIELYQGFSGIITGITTSAGTGGNPIALNFFFRADISDAIDLKIGYPVLINDTTHGDGVISINSSESDVVGIGTSFFDNVYVVNDKFNVGPICDITCNISAASEASVVSIVGTGIAGDYLGKMSWGRLYQYSNRLNPVSIAVTGLTVDSGLSTFPTIQRRGYGFLNAGGIAIG